MRAIRYAVIAAITFFMGTTLLSVGLFSKCRCVGRRFTPYLCLIKGWTPPLASDLPSCRENLLALENAKWEWARARGAEAGSEVSWSELRVYLDNGKPPVCRRGGEYDWGRIGRLPCCINPCRLHADPLEHAIDPDMLYAWGERNPLAAQRIEITEQPPDANQPEVEKH